MTKRGQITIFVIIAIIVVGLILFLFVIPGGPRLLTGQEFNPENFMKDCIEDDLGKNIIILSENAGYLEPEGVVMYRGDEYKYLCYTSRYYETCRVQQPFIKNNFEKELKLIVEPKAGECAKLLVEEYESRGFDVSAGVQEVEVKIIPEKIQISVNSDITISKDGQSQKIEFYNYDKNSEMYDLLFIAQSIIDYEATYGDSETTLYMQYYPDLKIEKTKIDDGTTIYKLTNVITDEEFRFASRSLVWPPGLGTE